MDFYCKAGSRMPVKLVSKSIEDANEQLTEMKVNKSDVKIKAKVLKDGIKNLAVEDKINLV